MTQSNTKPPLWKIWWVAARPHTLTASIAPIIVAYNAGKSILDPKDTSKYFSLTLQWAIFCMLMQLGTNLHNDYADFVKGADTEKRVGQARATQKGWLSPVQTATAATSVLSLGFILGLNLASFIDQNDDNGMTNFIFMIFIVLSSIFNAFAYTGGPWPLGHIGLGNVSIGYAGLGDLFVFLYFGLVATLMIPFLYISSNSSSDDLSMSLLWKFLPYSVQVAVLAMNIIVVNNLRDRHTDVDAHKRTLAVRFGAEFCRLEFQINIAIAYGVIIVDWVLHSFSGVRLLPLISFPLARREIKAVCSKEGGLLNPHVGGSATVQFLFCILLGTAIRFS